MLLGLLADRVAVIRHGRIVADLLTSELLDRYAEDRYQIRLSGGVLPAKDLPDGSHISTDDGFVRITLPTSDDDALREVLHQVHRSGARLLSVEQVRPDLEEAFVHLVQES
jgi:ABC-2 type transport system ATP-binding protein